MKRIREFIHSLARGTPAERDAKIHERLTDEPRCAVARYLAGCASFDAGRPASAVSDLMVAHHADSQLESAALLVFAGLSACGRPHEPLLRVMLETWEEFRRPKFDRTPRERWLLDALAVSDGALRGASSLARRLGRLPIPTLRRQIVQAIASSPVEPYGLLIASAAG